MIGISDLSTRLITLCALLQLVALRAVSTTDFMTADWYHLPYEVLGKISNRIINEVGTSRCTTRSPLMCAVVAIRFEGSTVLRMISHPNRQQRSSGSSVEADLIQGPGPRGAGQGPSLQAAKRLCVESI